MKLLHYLKPVCVFLLLLFFYGLARKKSYLTRHNNFPKYCKRGGSESILKSYYFYVVVVSLISLNFRFIIPKIQAIIIVS